MSTHPVRRWVKQTPEVKKRVRTEVLSLCHLETKTKQKKRKRITFNVEVVVFLWKTTLQSLPRKLLRGREGNSFFVSFPKVPRNLLLLLSKIKNSYQLCVNTKRLRPICLDRVRSDFAWTWRFGFNCTNQDTHSSHHIHIHQASPHGNTTLLSVPKQQGISLQTNFSPHLPEQHFAELRLLLVSGFWRTNAKSHFVVCKSPYFVPLRSIISWMHLFDSQWELYTCCWACFWRKTEREREREREREWESLLFWNHSHSKRTETRVCCRVGFRLFACRRK